jgi:hypothetical protein
MITTIHPSYDPKAKVWFLDGSPVEAPTIKELLAKMPVGTVVKDYHSLSGGALPPAHRPPSPPVPPVNVRPLSAVVGIGHSPARKHVKKTTPPLPYGSQRPSRKFTPQQYEQVLDLWANGMNGNRIALIVGLPRVVVSSQIVSSARERGDKRALTMAEKKERRIKAERRTEDPPPPGS